MVGGVEGVIQTKEQRRKALRRGPCGERLRAACWGREDRASSGPSWSQALRTGLTARLRELGYDLQTRGA